MSAISLPVSALAFCRDRAFSESRCDICPVICWSETPTSLGICAPICATCPARRPISCCRKTTVGSGPGATRGARRSSASPRTIAAAARSAVTAKSAGFSMAMWTRDRPGGKHHPRDTWCVRTGRVVYRRPPGVSTRAAGAAGTSGAHQKEGEFQIPRLGDGEVHRMIGRLAPHLDEGDVPSRVGGGVAQHLQELLRSEMVGAGGCGDDRPWRRQTEGAQVDLLVAADGGLDGAGALGERRWIEDEEPEPFLAPVEILQVIEGIALDPFAALAQSIQGGVAPRQVEALRRDLDRGAALGAGLQRVEAERSGVAEDVEHAAAAGVRLQGAPVETVVEVHAGLLAGPQPDEKTQVVQGDLDLVRHLPRQQPGARLESLARAHRQVAA